MVSGRNECNIAHLAVRSMLLQDILIEPCIMRGLLRHIIARLMGRGAISERVRNGMRIGHDVHIGPLSFIYPDHCYLISIGDGSTLAPRVTILAHDASTKKLIGKTRIARGIIGRGVFIGAGSIILPGVTIGDDSIIGAGSVVTKDIPSMVLALANPARVVMSIEQFIAKHRARMLESPTIPAAFRAVGGEIDPDAKHLLWEKLTNASGYVD